MLTQGKFETITLHNVRFFVSLTSNTIPPVQILVPGAGLGRLSWEFARLGYACQGNEVSLYMLIASHFVLNK